ncbi:zinc ribbon domain-containing protein [Natrarchaeobius halalkaliphilus]|uniref:Zinc ribbon domain-containing protein n=1 Tax=Natrarchaeobius halalkaliphilus TaxID=1679091 RepID=A0A3N6M6I7_9EURY|nr:zinc ribbon domain-containing protein [Natrarchaeobius halalkaliphilus]RQG88926.1 zinc ribbon domain-containing protein [Natrarchaeobius halalkaliphilus]
MTWLRALAAAGLSVLLPGAGHALIRDWLRTLVFAGLYLTAAVLFLPSPEQIAAAGSITDSMELVTQEIDTMGQFILSFIVLFAAIDATFRSLGFPPGSNSKAADGPTCPHCGKELDQDLSFCHWCTTRLEPQDPEEPTDAEQDERPIRANN